MEFLVRPRAVRARATSGDLGAALAVDLGGGDAPVAYPVETGDGEDLLVALEGDRLDQLARGPVPLDDEVVHGQGGQQAGHGRREQLGERAVPLDNGGTGDPHDVLGEAGHQGRQVPVVERRHVPVDRGRGVRRRHPSSLPRNRAWSWPASSTVRSSATRASARAPCTAGSEVPRWPGRSRTVLSPSQTSGVASPARSRWALRVRRFSSATGSPGSGGRRRSRSRWAYAFCWNSMISSRVRGTPNISRYALWQLELQGLVEGHQGKGVFVVEATRSSS